MSRPLRIEYENAVYHVMNRGRGRAMVFHNDDFNTLFLQGVQEASEQFGLEVLAYCLMGNHYHLLVRTPHGNLSRCMRHVNGVYTQRYNARQKTDGSLFRGRYKAILVDADNYLLQVSRYIHRNPIETKKPRGNVLATYQPSSYPAYINQATAPDWLNRDWILSLFNTPKKYQAYKAFVEGEHTDTLNEFYSKPHQPAVLGTKSFAAKVKQYARSDKTEIAKHQLHKRVSLTQVVEAVANHFNVAPIELLHTARGAGKKNLPRQIAMYLCQALTGVTLAEMAEHFNVAHYSTVSKTIQRLKSCLQTDRTVAKAVNVLSQDLTL